MSQPAASKERPEESEGFAAYVAPETTHASLRAADQPHQQPPAASRTGLSRWWQQWVINGLLILQGVIMILGIVLNVLGVMDTEAFLFVLLPMAIVSVWTPILDRAAAGAGMELHQGQVQPSRVVPCKIVRQVHVTGLTTVRSDGVQRIAQSTSVMGWYCQTLPEQGPSETVLALAPQDQPEPTPGSVQFVALHPTVSSGGLLVAEPAVGYEQDPRWEQIMRWSPVTARNHWISRGIGAGSIALAIALMFLGTFF